MVKDLFKKGIGAITSRQTSIFSAALFIVITSAFGSFLGIFKYRIFTTVYGDSLPELGIFFAAFKIPDFIFQVFIASALTSAFIPIFSDFLEKDRKDANKFVSSVMTLGTIFYIVAAGVIAIFAEPIVSKIAVGFNPEQLSLMVHLTRIILFSQVFFILGMVSTGVLQTLEHFLYPGIALALYNVGIIIGTLAFGERFGIYGAVIGVFIGAALFFIFQIPLLKKYGFQYSFTLAISEGVKAVGKLMLPRALTVLLMQISIIANVFFILFISAESMVFYELAFTIMYAPVNLFGLSIAQASFPTLAKKVRDREGFIEIFVASFNQILYLTLPMSVLLIVLRIPIVRLFYGAKDFSWEATVMTGMTLAILSVSLATQALTLILTRAFFALKDTKTPFVITAVSIALHIGLSLLFVIILKKPVYFLALSLSISNIVTAILLTVALHVKIHLPKLNMTISVVKILVATLIMGFSLYIPIKLLDQLVFDTTRTINLIILTGISSFLGLLSFLFFTWLLEIREAYYILAVVKKFSSRTPILRTIGELIDGTRINT